MYKIEKITTSIGKQFKKVDSGTLVTVLSYDTNTDGVRLRREDTNIIFKVTGDSFLDDYMESGLFIKQPLTKKKMTREQMSKTMDAVIAQMQEFRAAGQKEYAREDDNAFANFERVAERCKISREKVLMVYLEKHLDGMHSYIDGHKSQREDVRGRIVDGIVYLTLLYGMVDENEDYAIKTNPHL